MIPWRRKSKINIILTSSDGSILQDYPVVDKPDVL